MEDPNITAWRINYVAQYNEANRGLRQLQTQKLEDAQNRVHDYLKTANFNPLIRRFLSTTGHHWSQTKTEKGKLPLDGLLEIKHKPAFILDHYGEVSFNGKHQEAPGVRYAIRCELDQFVLVVTICASDSGRIFPFFLLTHEDGRFHKIDWRTQYTSPTESQLARWLKNNLHKKHHSPS